MTGRIALALLLSLAATASVAQQETDEDKDNWYRVELLVFANRDSATARAEHWPLLPVLSYPERWLVLKHGELNEPADKPLAFESLEDQASGPLDLYWDRSIKALWTEYYEKQLRRFDPGLTLELPRQRALLPASTRELNFQRKRIDEAANLDVLFHQSWIQRIEDEERSLPLILDGPAQFGDYPELQGSVLLYSGRYLHIVTNLWLNTAGRYLDANPATAGWSMPPPPLPVAREDHWMTPFRVDVSPWWLDPAGGLLPEPSAEAPASGDPAAVSAAAGTDATLQQQGTSSAPPRPARSMAPGPDYEFRHAILVKQRRRMRSGELHYIDHPMLGMVVKVSRYEFEPFFPELTDQAGDSTAR